MSASGTRAILRIARRSIERNRWRSLLVGLLITLPVAGMVSGMIWLRTTTPTAEARATSSMGVADLWVYPMDPDRKPTTEQLQELLPRGSQVEPFTYSDGLVLLRGRTLEVTVRSIDLAGLGEGALRLVEGRLPVTGDEVATSRSVAAAANTGIGDAIELDEFGTATVVGFVENPGWISAAVVLQHPSLAASWTAEPDRNWLVALPEGASEPNLAPVFEASPRHGYGSAGDATPGTLVLGSLVLMETVLIGAAAFAVSIRRRQRELGLLAAAGSSRRQLAGTVLAEGALLAGTAALIGLVIGIGLMVLVSPWLDEITDRRNPSLVLDVVGLALAVGAGLAAGLTAAAVPAWTAARMSVLTALSGRRPPSSSARRTLLLGLALVGLSVAVTGGGAALLLGNRTDGAGLALLVAGAILGVLGFGACSPWLIDRLEWLGSRLPVSGRLALRDTARARSRTAPIVTAILAGLAAAIAVSSLAAFSSYDLNRSWRPWTRPDQLLLSGGPQQERRNAAALAGQFSALASAPIAGELYSSDGLNRDLSVWITEAGDAPVLDPEDGCPDCRLGVGWPSVGTPEFLVALGVPPEAATVPPDSMLLLTDEPFEARTATLAVREVVRQNITPDGDLFDVWHYTHTETLPARAIEVGASAGEVRRFPNAFIAPETAARLGFAPSHANNGYVIRLDRPVTEEDLALAATLVGSSGYVEAAFPPRDPNAMTRLLAALVSVVLALTITAIAVALGESEARADQRTLLAVGADPRLRRRIVAARAGVIALLAALLAVPAGLLPVWGLLASRNEPLFFPLPEVLAIVVALPLAAMAGALLLSRPIPAWSAFRDVAP